MKHLKKYLAALAVTAWLMATSAKAGVSLDIYIDGLETSSAGTAVLLVDSGGDGFGDFTFTSEPLLVGSQWTTDADDLALAIIPLQSSGLVEGATGEFQLTGGISTGDQLMLVWYPNLAYNGSLTGPGVNQIFGTYRDNLAADEGNGLAGFVVPTDGFGGSLARESGVNGYNGASLSGFQTIPEPSSTLLVLSGLGMLAFFRRRKH